MLSNMTISYGVLLLWKNVLNPPPDNTAPAAIPKSCKLDGGCKNANTRKDIQVQTHASSAQPVEDESQNQVPSGFCVLNRSRINLLMVCGTLLLLAVIVVHKVAFVGP